MAPSTPAPATPAELTAVTAETVSIGLTRIERLIPRVNRAHVPELVRWVCDPKRWESTASLPFWGNVLGLLVELATPDEVVRLPSLERERYPSLNQSTLYRMIDACVELVSRRHGTFSSQADLNAAAPRAKAKLQEHCMERVGDPRWTPGAQLTEAVARASFRLASEEGLPVLAALMWHGDPESVGQLASRVAGQPVLAVVLRSHGIEVEDVEAKQAGLLAAIARAPDDVAPRQVFADWLMERNDPRGEFIRAQLAGEAVSPRNDRQAIAWAGPVGESMRTKKEPHDVDARRRTPVFEGGMLAGACVQALDGTASEASEWATLRVLDVMKSAERIDAYPLPRLSGLGGLNGKDLETVRDSAVGKQLVAIGVDTVPNKVLPHLWDLLLGFPRVRLVAIDRWHDVESLADHPLLDHIQVLVTPRNYRETDATLRVVSRVTEVIEGWPYDRGTLLALYDRIVKLG